MRKNSINGLIFIILLFILSSCSYDYSITTVPEEGGMKFHKITDRKDVVLGNIVMDLEEELDEGLVWSGASSIDYSKSAKRIAFVGKKNNKKNVFIKNVEKGQTTTQRTFRTDVDGVAFSSDGENIAFVDYYSKTWDIFTINATKGAAIRQITKSPAEERNPVFAPDDKKIYFEKSSSRLKNYIWSYNIKTGMLTQIAEGSQPDVSPDGSKLYVTRFNKETENTEIWSIDLETGEESIILSDDKKGFSTPKVSPNGEYLLIVGTSPREEDRPRNLDLYRIKINGTNLTQLTFHGGHDNSPSWGKNNKTIYFVSQRGNEEGRYNIWSIELQN